MNIIDSTNQIRWIKAIRQASLEIHGESLSLKASKELVDAIRALPQNTLPDPFVPTVGLRCHWAADETVTVVSLFEERGVAKALVRREFGTQTGRHEIVLAQHLSPLKDFKAHLSTVFGSANAKQVAYLHVLWKERFPLDGRSARLRRASLQLSPSTALDSFNDLSEAQASFLIDWIKA